MRLRKIRLQNFRNFEFVELNFNQQGNQFFCGENGQGKTNLLESIYLCSTLRSFRTGDIRHMIRFGQKEAHVLLEVEHDFLDNSTVHIILKTQGREVYLNQTKLLKVSEILGHFPSVMMSSQDILLIRGGPSVRRQFMDIFICTFDSGYLNELRKYQQGILERNKILKQFSLSQPSTVHLLDVFEQMISKSAVYIMQKRVEYVQKLSVIFSGIHELFSKASQGVKLEYMVDIKLPLNDAPEKEYFKMLKVSREKDFIMKGTMRGPHKDDFEIKMNNVPVKYYGSEGEQRGVVLALRLAQLKFLQNKLHVNPFLLADDVWGELDPMRRSQFLKALPQDIQVMSTGTQYQNYNESNDWQLFNVNNGYIQSKDFILDSFSM